MGTTKLLAKVEANLDAIIEKFSYEENFSKKSYRQRPNLWVKYGKARLYVPRNAYEQAGYIDLLTGEIHETRPGNYSVLEEVLNFINSLPDPTEEQEEQAEETVKENTKEGLKEKR